MDWKGKGLERQGLEGKVTGKTRTKRKELEEKVGEWKRRELLEGQRLEERDGPGAGREGVDVGPGARNVITSTLTSTLIAA
ncbi:hypothetical protein Pmani_022188 [Petrolisthes manimaculis]|uniref:Uncharacterized protein n=1 Tax=Petrolisthes manimaculis TaxID=1843537 RepID=A0AAE1PEI5_9EUCA|nr:hypothetical protein Pmani_022188 [Petrolisthes manimaculis]